MLNKMLIFFFSINNLLFLLPLQAVQWKYYRVKKDLLIQEFFSIPFVSAGIFEPHVSLHFSLQNIVLVLV